jgi:hypothetical protein
MEAIRSSETSVLIRATRRHLPEDDNQNKITLPEAMNSTGLKKEHASLKVRACLLKSSRNLQILFTAVMHLLEGPSLETLLILKVEKSVIFLVGAQRPAASIKLPTILMTGRLMLADPCL